MQAKMRHKAKTDALANERRAEQIRDFQLELRQKYVDVSDFIRECNRKEKIADEKTKREMHVQQEMKTEIETMTKDIACLGDFLNTLNSKVEEYRPYQEILEEVLADTDLYKSKQDLIDRCDALRRFIIYSYIHKSSSWFMHMQKVMGRFLCSKIFF